ncbi:MAG: proton-conducting transporter membrane subunit [Candidatus Bathyarchaeota archaeon]|nr:proton-conducting transporter membrane subunit [Candidatus Bathyarchaeota archaeon]
MLPYAPWLCWLIPMIGALLTPLFASVHRKLRDYAPVAFVGASVVFSLSMALDVFTGNAVNWVSGEVLGNIPFDWQIPWVGSLGLNLGVLVDPFSVLMAIVVSSIGFLVTLFSVGFMRGDPSLTRFWFLIQLFIAGYLVIVIADNLLFMFIGWELVGICCAGLAAFWYKDPKKAHIGLKTFLVLHVADVLLLASLLIIYAYSHTLNIMELSQNNNWMGELSRSGLLFVTALMFFGGAVGKAAQFPLQEWLPDALAASPSSFNALTECLAGPFLMARVLPIFHEASVMGYSGMINFFLVMTFVGALTAVISALIAIVQVNIFKVLSYGISSAIGYMMAAFGLAGLMADMSWGYLAGTFLLTIDSFVSALLFLSAAYISYAVGSDNLHYMSGFKSRIAHRSMEVGALALGGIPLLSGFWCANWIQTVALDFAQEAGLRGQFMLMVSGYLIFALLIIGAGITAFYALRMLGLVFGKESYGSDGKVIKNPPFLMRSSLTITLLVTAFLDFLAILLIWPFNKFLLPLPFLGQLTFNNIVEVLVYLVPSISTVLTCVAVAFGGYPAYRIYVSHKADARRLTEKYRFLKAAHKLLLNRFYINAFYYKVAYSTCFLSHKIHNSLEYRIDALNYSVAGFFRRLSEVVYKYPELRGIDALNYLIANLFTSFSQRFRKIQTGVLSYNMILAFIGATLLIVLLFLFGGHIP